MAASRFTSLGKRLRSTSNSGAHPLPGTERNRLMKRFLLFTGIVALAAPFAMAQTSTWAIDPAHSQIDFVVRHLTLSNIHGRFGNLKGNIVMSDTDVTKSSVQVTIDVTSLDTGVAQRDSDVKGANFFDTDKFPTATFTST